MGEVRHQQAQQQVLQGRRLLAPAEVLRHQRPEGLLDPEALQLRPDRRRPVQIGLAAAIGQGIPADSEHAIEQGDQHAERLGLIGLHQHGDDLAVDVQRLVIRADQPLQPLQPVTAGEEPGAFGQMAAQGRLGQPEIGQQHRGTIGAEAAAVEADVEQPVLLRRGRREGGIEQVAPFGVLQLQPRLDGQGWMLVQAQRGDIAQVQGIERLAERLIRVVPEDDAVPVPAKTVIEGLLDALGVHWLLNARWALSTDSQPSPLLDLATQPVGNVSQDGNESVR